LTSGGFGGIKKATVFPFPQEHPMVELLTTLMPIALFWILEATYLGGWPVDAHGGSGIQQVLGLLLSFVLWVVVWRVLHAALLGVGPVLGGLFITTVVATVLLPLTTWIGFKIVGVTVKQTASAH
jgi:hypothetical protein